MISHWWKSIDGTYYECDICGGLNHAARPHCQYCDTVPAKYSWNGKPSQNHFPYDSVVAAIGADRQQRHKAARSYFRTVPLDYYADDPYAPDVARR